MSVSGGGGVVVVVVVVVVAAVGRRRKWQGQDMLSKLPESVEVLVWAPPGAERPEGGRGVAAATTSAASVEPLGVSVETSAFATSGNAVCLCLRRL